VDRSGAPRIGTIPPGELRPDEETRLKALVAAELPDFYAAIITRTKVARGGLVDAPYGSGLSFRDPDNIAPRALRPARLRRARRRVYNW
jgi:hypothetical protein